MLRCSSQQSRIWRRSHEHLLAKFCLLVELRNCACYVGGERHIEAIRSTKIAESFIYVPHRVGPGSGTELEIIPSERHRHEVIRQVFSDGRQRYNSLDQIDADWLQICGTKPSRDVIPLAEPCSVLSRAGSTTTGQHVPRRSEIGRVFEGRPSGYRNPSLRYTGHFPQARSRIREELHALLTNDHVELLVSKWKIEGRCWMPSNVSVVRDRPSCCQHMRIEIRTDHTTFGTDLF